MAALPVRSVKDHEPPSSPASRSCSWRKPRRSTARKARLGASVHVAARDRLAGRPAVSMDGVGEARECGRIERPLREAPAVIRPCLSEVDLLEGPFADIADIERSGPAVEARPPRVAQSSRENAGPQGASVDPPRWTPGCRSAPRSSCSGRSGMHPHSRRAAGSCRDDSGSGRWPERRRRQWPRRDSHRARSRSSRRGGWWSGMDSRWW